MNIPKIRRSAAVVATFARANAIAPFSAMARNRVGVSHSDLTSQFPVVLEHGVGRISNPVPAGAGIVADFRNATADAGKSVIAAALGASLVDVPELATLSRIASGFAAAFMVRDGCRARRAILYVNIAIAAGTISVVSSFGCLAQQTESFQSRLEDACKKFPPTGPRKRCNPLHLSQSLKITNVRNPSGGNIIEFAPTFVDFEFSTKIVGDGGPPPESLPTRDICPERLTPETTCVTIAAPFPGETYKGTITALPPYAALAGRVRIVALDSRRIPGGEFPAVTVVTDAVAVIPIAARYDIAIPAVTVKDTLSLETDTDWLTLQGMIVATPADASSGPDACKLAGFKWCIAGVSVGDAHDGLQSIPDARISYFDLVPNRETDLRFLFYLYNAGASPWQSIGNIVADAFSKIGEIVLSAYSPSSSGAAQQLDSAMESFHKAAFGSCDGPLATDVMVFENVAISDEPQNTLDAFTRPNGVFQAETKEYKQPKRGANCDSRGSDYTLTYKVIRTSWQEWDLQTNY